jgi:pyrroline-5-carboxylate reductase
MSAIGFLGAGNMGEALIRGWDRATEVSLAAFDPDRERLERLCSETRLQAAESPEELTRNSDYVVLAVKPAVAGRVVQEIAPSLSGSQCLVSVAAGIRLDSLMEWSRRACPVVRVMPNTPVLVGSGVFAICLDDARIGQEQAQFLKETFRLVGQVHVVSEPYFDAFTALAGSGPAYVAYAMESMIEAGVAMGFQRKESQEIVLSVFQGTATLARHSGHSATTLREMVTSPGGATSAGMLELDRKGVRSSIVDAVLAAARRSRELGG